MISIPKYGCRILFAGLLPTDIRSDDKISNDVKTAKDFLTRPPSTETGLDRLKMIFHIDEFGNLSQDLISVYQAGFLGFFIGGIYGGVIQSRTAYTDFMENNQATTFTSHLDAKRKLQDRVTMNFAKGAFRWGWRTALFTTSYMGITTLISVYREKSSIYEYLVAGGVTGSLYKVNLGLRGVMVGGLLGTVLGGIGGCVSLLLLKASGTSMEQVRYWQYKWKLKRDDVIRESIKVQTDADPEINLEHDQKLSSIEPSLKDIKE